MGTYDTYRELNGALDQRGQEPLGEAELLHTNTLQQLWAEARCPVDRYPDESAREAAIAEHYVEYGGWFRENVLTEESRKSHFLSLVKTDPAVAVAEVEALFAATRH